MTVKRLLRELDSPELSEWAQHFAIEAEEREEEEEKQRAEAALAALKSNVQQKVFKTGS